MSGRSHRQQWRRLSVIKPNDKELPAKPTQRTGEPEAPARARVPERFKCGKGRAHSEPTRLRDQFIGRKRPKDSERPEPKKQNKTQNIVCGPLMWHRRLAFDL